MTFLVTGGTGFLGSHLVNLLAEQGACVRIIARPGEPLPPYLHGDLDVHRGDLLETSSLRAGVEGVDCVLHCAARTGAWGAPAGFEKVNVLGTQQLLKAAITAGVRRFVHVSSITVHGTDIRGSGDEEMGLRGGPDPYSRTKAQTEGVLHEMIRRDGAPVTIVRPGLIYGPRDVNSFARIASLIEQRRMPIIGTGENHLPLIFVSDVVQGILLAAESPGASGRAYLLASDEAVTQLDYFTAIAAELGVPPPACHLPYRLALALGSAAEAAGHATRSRRPPPVTRFGVRQIGGDNRFLVDRARSELGFSPRMSLADGVHESVAWYRGRDSSRSAIEVG